MNEQNVCMLRYLTISGQATMEDTVSGDNTATPVLEVSKGEEVTSSHHCPVTALEVI